MNAETKPSVLIVYYTLTKQVGRVADAMAQEFEMRGCDVAKALLEFTDERWAPKLSEFPMKRPIPQIASILPAQLRHKTGEIRIPPEAQKGDYDLVWCSRLPPGGSKRACRSAPISSHPRRRPC